MADILLYRNAASGHAHRVELFLALRYDHSGAWYPREPLAAARVQRWLSVAAGQLAAGPATARLIKLFGRALDHGRAVWVAEQLFAVMEQTLASQAFLTGARPTIADLAMYTYTAHAPEGGVFLDPYPNVRAWLTRIEALPRFVPMQRASA